MSLDALKPLFSGPLASYEGRLVPWEDARPGLPGTDLIAPAILGDHLARFARNYAAPDPRAVASIWSKHHFAALIVPTLAASLILDRALPVSLDAVEVVCAPDGHTVALKLRDAGTRAEDASRFRALVEGHVAPLAAALAAISGLAPRVVWGNAGNVVDAILRKAEAFPVVDRARLDAAWGLLRRRRLADGRANPLFDQIREAGPPGAPLRRRKVCCIRYLIPAQTLCAACPLTPRPA